MAFFLSFSSTLLSGTQFYLPADQVFFYIFLLLLLAILRYTPRYFFAATLLQTYFLILFHGRETSFLLNWWCV